MPLKRYQTFSARLNLWILSLGSLVFISVLGVNYYSSRQVLEDYVKDLAIATIQTAVNDTGSVLDSVANSAETLSSLVQSSLVQSGDIKPGDIDKQGVLTTIQAVVRANPDVYGMTVALEPGVIDGTKTGFAPYYYRDGEQLHYSDLSDADYDYRQWDWYRRPLDSGQASWSEPYLDEGGGNTTMTTYSTPITDQGNVIGVATADLELAWLHQLVSKIKIGKSGYGFVVSAGDIIMSHPNTAYNMRKLMETAGANALPENIAKYQASKESTESIYLKVDCRHTTGKCYVAIKSLANTGWKIFIVIPENELVSDIQALTLMNALVAAAGLTALLVVISVVTGKLTSPLSRLAEATRDIGRGKLDTAIPEPGSRDEIAELSHDFNTMRLALHEHIEKVREATASKQKLESEIQIAKDIQMSMIPGNGNAFIETSQLDLFAFLRPAKSVGGDLYYFSMEDGRFRFIMGDVSDKGVPAALFMAKTVTLYTRALRDELSPGDTLTMMNDILSENNDACMFVTALCGDLDMASGKLVMANAGHMNPVQHAPGGVSEIAVDGGMALGLMAGAEYGDNNIQLASNTQLVMYTDGISEAKNMADEEYLDSRLFDFIGQSETSTDVKTLGTGIVNEVDNFAGEREQFDDMTLFVMHYH